MELYGSIEFEASLSQKVEGVFVKVCSQFVWHVVGLRDSGYCHREGPRMKKFGAPSPPRCPGNWNPMHSFLQFASFCWIFWKTDKERNL